MLPNKTEMNEPGKFIGLSQGVGVTFNRAPDGSALSLLYDYAQINYDPKDFASGNKKTRYSSSFTLLTNKRGVSIRYLIRGDLRASDKNQAKISFLIENKKINVPISVDGAAFLACFDYVLPEVETLVEWEMELAELKNEAAIMSLDSIDIVVMNQHLPRDCVERG